MKKIIFIALLAILLISTNSVALKITNISNIDENVTITAPFQQNKIYSPSTKGEDLDPLVDLEVTVTIKEIRALDKIDRFSDPDFYVKVFINDEKFKSEIWRNQKYVKEEWHITVDVPDDVETVNITIQLWDRDFGLDKLCDIARSDNSNPNRREIFLNYSLKSGHWSGDDLISPPHSWYVDYSGYGRANGCDDNSIYDEDRDCEIWFDISQNDYDGDGIPYWTEVNKFGTDPEVDDTGMDDDEDGVPIEWEYKWGHYIRYNRSSHSDEHDWFYDPFVKDDHENLDPDGDSLNNVEEYLTSEWGSDPFRKDLFVELDQMEEGPNGEPESLLPQGSKDLIQDAFDKQNVVFHLDDGFMGRGEMIPFDSQGDNTTYEELIDIYNDYFLHGNENNWRRGVFHYGLAIYNASGACGFMFRNNAFQISRVGMEKQILFNRNEEKRDVVYASAYMHELGHTLGLMWLGGHNTNAYYFWQINWWKWRPYKSVMNYGYMYGFIWDLVDYSDGSRGRNDFDDWSNLDLEYFDL